MLISQLSSLHLFHTLSGSFTPSTSSGQIHEIRLLKEPGKGLGIRIADHISEGGSQVIVAEVLKGGAADMDGKLKKGRYSG